MPRNVNVWIEPQFLLEEAASKKKKPWQKLRWKIRIQWTNNRGKTKEHSRVIKFEDVLDEFILEDKDMQDMLLELALRKARLDAGVDEEA